MTDQDKDAEIRRLAALITVLDALLQNNVVDAPTMKRLRQEIDAHWAQLEQLGVQRPN